MTDATDAPPRVLSLSPSRAMDFKACPLMYRFRTVDRLPEATSRAAVRGTLVHAVLERIFDLPATERTVQAAWDLLLPAWADLQASDPRSRGLFGLPAAETPLARQVALELGLPEVPGAAESAEAEWLASARELVATWFRLEDPTRLEPAGREERVEVETEGLRLRGIVDRLDVSPDGQIRIVDYKTGASPRATSEARAMFQLKFYALVIWRQRGVLPSMLQLVYLADAETLRYRPEPSELEAFGRTLGAVGAAIAEALATGDFRPHPGPPCGWCSFRDHCPTFGNTPPPYPAGVAPTSPELDGPPA